MKHETSPGCGALTESSAEFPRRSPTLLRSSAELRTEVTGDFTLESIGLSPTRSLHDEFREGDLIGRLPRLPGNYGR